MALRVSYGLGYGNPKIPGSLTASVDIEGGGGFWDVDNWDEFFWDATVFSSEGVPLAGTANNIAVIIFGSGKKIRPFTIQTIEIHHIPRRLRRE